MSQPPTRIRRTQAERRAESERRIIRAARELFAKQGYVRTTLNEVGSAAGYTGGLVSHRFGSKEGLLRQVVESISGRFHSEQVIPAISRDSAVEAISNFIDVYLQEIHKHESRMRALYVIMGEALGSVPEIRKEIAWLNGEFRQRFIEIIERGIAEGEFRQHLDVNAAALLILGLLRGVTMQILLEPKVFNPDEVIPLVQQQVLISLRQNPKVGSESHSLSHSAA